MRRRNDGPEQTALRLAALSFFREAAVPHLKEWTEAGVIDRELFVKAGALGLLGIQAPSEWGGTDLHSFTFNVVVSEAAIAAGFANIGLRLHTDIALPYFLRYANDDQKARWLPDLVAGRKIAAIAMSEPGTGSDLAGIQTSARRDGLDYVLDGAKSFITNGINADLVIVIARTSSDMDDRRHGLTALVVERGMAGFARGSPLAKMGLRYSDTAELFFDAVRVPADNRLGEEGEAFTYLTSNLPQERVSISVGAVAMARTAVELTVAYVKERQVFGQRLSRLQNTRFVLADAATEVEAAEHLLDRAVEELDAGCMTAPDAAKVKLFCTEMQGRVLDKCLQLFGGYGYLREYPIAEMFTDARVTRIYGGSSEVMKMVIAKGLGL